MLAPSRLWLRTQAIQVLLVLLALFILGSTAALLLLAFSHGQLTEDVVLDYITPPAQQAPAYATLVGPGGEPLLLANHRVLGVVSVPEDELSGEVSGLCQILLASGRPLRGRDRKPLRLVLGGPAGQTLLDDIGSPLLGLGGLPLEVSGQEVASRANAAVLSIAERFTARELQPLRKAL